MGLLIHHPKAVFFWACKLEQCAEVLVKHFAQWGRETVKDEHGNEVVQPIDRSKVRAEYVKRWDGDKVAESVPVEVK